MENDFSYINTETDLNHATEAVAERIRSSKQQLKANSQELPGALRDTAIRKTLPWVLGAATVVVGSLLIRKWIRHSKSFPAAVSNPIAKATTSRFNPGSIAIQLLPVASIMIKKWLTKDKSVTANPTRSATANPTVTP